MSIHLVEAPGWLCTIYGTTKAKKASISTRMQPRMLIRFFKYLYIELVLAQLLDPAFDAARVVATTAVAGQTPTRQLKDRQTAILSNQLSSVEGQTNSNAE